MHEGGLAQRLLDGLRECLGIGIQISHKRCTNLLTMESGKTATATICRVKDELSQPAGKLLTTVHCKETILLPLGESSFLCKAEASSCGGKRETAGNVSRET